MKRISLLITILFCFIHAAFSQQVDSIKVEQSGDFIKIRYKILNSSQNQLYRVRVLCAINSGLNTEIISVSGDTGDNVVGGKSEYFVVWDVLKDVAELNSAEFIVRAELVKDLNVSNIQGVKNNSITEKWSKKRIFFMLSAEAPSPKVGFRIGYMGSFGISFQFVNGNVAMNEQVISVGSITYNPPKTAVLGLNLSKRIVNNNSFQMHLLAGLQKTELVFRDPNANATPFHRVKVFGPEAGIVFGIKSFAFSLAFAHFDPGPVEKTSDREAVSPLSYLSTSIGVRF